MESMTNTYTCCLCGNDADGFGNSARPLSAYPAKCCDDCNAEKVLPARIAALKEKRKKEPTEVLQYFWNGTSISRVEGGVGPDQPTVKMHGAAQRYIAASEQNGETRPEQIVRYTDHLNEMEARVEKHQQSVGITRGSRSAADNAKARANPYPCTGLEIAEWDLYVEALLQLGAIENDEYYGRLVTTVWPHEETVAQAVEHGDAAAETAPALPTWTEEALELAVTEAREKAAAEVAAHEAAETEYCQACRTSFTCGERVVCFEEPFTLPSGRRAFTACACCAFELQLDLQHAWY
jgi:hypothetical protein